MLDPSQVRKMDDFLPLMMFTIDNVCNALKMNREDVAVTLLPIALALDAVMNGNLTRIERLDYLATAWAFFWCYKQAYSIMPSEMKCQTSSKQKGMNRHMQIYDMNTLDKGLSLFYSLSVVISDAKPVHLGALGTHWLEHLFGNVRRLCNRNDTPENFQRCLLLTVFKKLVLTQADGSFQPRKRLSDSGAFLDPEPTPSSSRMPLGSSAGPVSTFESQISNEIPAWDTTDLMPIESSSHKARLRFNYSIQNDVSCGTDNKEEGYNGDTSLTKSLV